MWMVAGSNPTLRSTTRAEAAPLRRGLAGWLFHCCLVISLKQLGDPRLSVRAVSETKAAGRTARWCWRRRPPARQRDGVGDEGRRPDSAMDGHPLGDPAAWPVRSRSGDRLTTRPRVFPRVVHEHGTRFREDAWATRPLVFPRVVHEHGTRFREDAWAPGLAPQGIAEAPPFRVRVSLRRRLDSDQDQVRAARSGHPARIREGRRLGIS
jgi:hypothetical protein